MKIEFDLNNFLREYRRVRRIKNFLFDVARPHIVCHDGFTVSVQAGDGKGSKPAVNGADHYTHVEVGYLSAWDDLLSLYGDKDDSVFWYVPVAVAEALIIKHGGFKGVK